MRRDTEKDANDHRHGGTIRALVPTTHIGKDNTLAVAVVDKNIGDFGKGFLEMRQRESGNDRRRVCFDDGDAMVIRVESTGTHNIEHFAGGEKGGSIHMENLLVDLHVIQSSRL